MDAAPQVVEVFADVWCPFAHVGLRRLVAARAERGRGEVRLRVRPWPLELVNDGPLDADVVAAEVDELRDGVAGDLFAGFDPASFPRSTLPALHLTEAAYVAGPDVGEAVALELRDRLFERGQDVGDPLVLAEVADAHGVAAGGEPGEDPVLASYQQGKDRGVIGSPHFFVRDEGWFCPALDVHEEDGRLVIAADPEAFEAFLDRCLAP